MNIKEIRETLDNTKVYINGKGIELRAKLESFGYCMREKMNYSILPFWYIGKSGHIGGGSNMEDFRNRNCREVSVDDILNIEIDKPKYSLKPFDKIIIRIGDGVWRPSMYAFYNAGELHLVGGTYIDSSCCQVVPFNKDTEHLIGTKEKYKEE